MNANRDALAGATIVLAVTGGIAAYKAVEVARLLRKAGARVRPLLTRSAEKFVGAVTFSGITGEPVADDLWDPQFAGERHVELARSADAILVVPATADALARLAQGRADDLLTATILCAGCPVFVAPSMHPRMWAHPATARNTALLRQDGVTLLGPVFGAVASGEEGLGRMEEPAAIVDALRAALTARQGPRPLAGRTVVVTAGPTYEPVDPVRFLGNRSSGAMGFAIAEAAAAAGATVTLIAGPVARATPRGVERVDIETAAELLAATTAAAGRADAVIMAAAVADFRPVRAEATKIKKQDGGGAPPLALARTVDVLATLGAARASGAGPRVLIGFALETGSDDEVLAYAQEKLQRKRCDLIVANRADEALGGATTRAFFVGPGGPLGPYAGAKEEVAAALVGWLVERLARPC